VTDNPHGKQHGAPADDNRHVGDLGNIKTDAQGNSKGSVSDSFVKLIGEHSVLGVRTSPPQPHSGQPIVCTEREPLC
jgi:Cu/Zn superoxide dismutase